MIATQQSESETSTDYHSSSNDDDTKSGEGSPCVSADASLSSIDDTLILLDWDDTLFPTSMIVDVLRKTDKNGLALVPNSQIELLNILGTLTLSLLTELIQKYGASNIHIVTNSLNGWIEDSLCYASSIANVYQQIQKLLIHHDITMKSAQTMYAEKHEGYTDVDSNPMVWKRLCFDGILNENQYTHVISIGDQWTDHISVKQSIHLLSSYTPLHHVIKLKTEPMIRDMINEMMYIQTCFGVFFNVSKISKPVIVDYHREEINNCIQSMD